MSTVGPSTSSASRGGPRRPPNLADDDLSDVEGLLDLLHPQVFGGGQLIFAEGDPGDRVYVIRSGVVKVTHSGPGGRRNLVALAGPGDILGEVAVFDPGPRTSTVLAVGAVDAGWLDRGALRRWLATEPSAAVVLLQLLARQVKRQHDQFAEQRVRDVEVRVTRLLLELAERFGVPSTDRMLAIPPLSTSELADLVGDSGPTTAETLRGLLLRNLVRADDDIVLACDRDGLQRL